MGKLCARSAQTQRHSSRHGNLVSRAIQAVVDLPPPEPRKLPEPPAPPPAPEPEAIQEAPELEEAVEEQEAEQLEEADQVIEAEEAEQPAAAQEEAPMACGMLAPVAPAGQQEADETHESQAPDLSTLEPKSQRAAYRAHEIMAQVHQVQEWLSLGKRPNQIRALCAEQWGLKTRAAEQRIYDARRQMVADANVMDRQEKVGQMLQQLEQVLEQALRLNQGSNAIGALRLQADLLQLLSRQN